MQLRDRFGGYGGGVACSGKEMDFSEISNSMINVCGDKRGVEHGVVGERGRNLSECVQRARVRFEGRLWKKRWI